MVLGSVLASVARRAPRGAAGAPRILQAPICTSGVRTAPAKPSIQSIGELRRAVPGTSMIKAREALLATRAPDAPVPAIERLQVGEAPHVNGTAPAAPAA